MTELSLLIVNYNSWEMCIQAVRTFRKFAPTHADGSPMSWQPIVVDNDSPQRDAELERKLAELCEACGGKLILHGENGGYSKGMNLALSHADGDWILVSNPDLLYLEGAVDRMLRAMERDDKIGAAAPHGFGDHGLEVQLPPNILPTLSDLWRMTRAYLSRPAAIAYSRRRTPMAVGVWTAEDDYDLEMLSGCCFLMKRGLIEEIGFFDERFPLYFEDTDLSMRLHKARKRIVQVGGSKIVHLYNRSAATNQEESQRRYWISRKAYYEKWYGWVGKMAYALSRKVLDSDWGKRRSAELPHAEFDDLGAGRGKPVLKLPRSVDRYLVEFTPDPYFFLAGGTFGSGDHWTPGDKLFRRFGPNPWWFRITEAVPPYRQLGIYRYDMLHPQIEEPHVPDSPEAIAGRLAEAQR